MGKRTEFLGKHTEGVPLNSLKSSQPTNTFHVLKKWNQKEKCMTSWHKPASDCIIRGSDMLHKSGTIELYNINTTKNQASFLVKRVRQDERVHIKSRFHLSLTSVKYMNFSWLREILCLWGQFVLPDHFLTCGNRAGPVYFSNASLKILHKGNTGNTGNWVNIYLVTTFKGRKGKKRWNTRMKS